MNGISIRSCEVGDLEAVSALLGETWHATYDNIYGAERVSALTKSWHSIGTLTENLGQVDATFLVAEREVRILGTAFARLDVETAKLMCDRIYVHPDAQGTGVGYALLGELIVRSGPAERICLEVESMNTRAIAFYERAGFKVTGQGTDCGGMGDNIDHLIMERTL